MSQLDMPIAGIDYPRTFEEFDKWFADDELCRKFIYRLRWPEGYKCSRCYSCAPPWISSICQKEVSITAGTIFERTRTPLRIWFLAI
jgi:hypothetical protein